MFFPDSIDPLLLCIIKEQPDQRLILAMIHFQTDDLIDGDHLIKAEIQRKAVTEIIEILQKALLRIASGQHHNGAGRGKSRPCRFRFRHTR